MAAGEPEGLEDAGEGARERILAIALRRFARDGYGKTRLREVASEAGVTTGPMYHHFGSKQELYREVGLRSLERLMEIYDQIARSGAAPSRRERAQAFFETLADANYDGEDYIWIGVQMELDAVRHPAVAELRQEWAHQLEHVFQLGLGTQPDHDADGWDHDPLLVLMLTLAHGASRAVVRNGRDTMPSAVRGLERLLAEPPDAA